MQLGSAREKVDLATPTSSNGMVIAFRNHSDNLRNASGSAASTGSEFRPKMKDVLLDRRARHARSGGCMMGTKEGLNNEDLELKVEINDNLRLSNRSLYLYN